MSAAAYYWPDTGRLECLGTFPSKPNLADRGAADGVQGRYVEMQNRGELSTLGDQTVPIAAWLKNVVEHVEGENVAAVIADRYRQAEVGEGLDAAGKFNMSSEMLISAGTSRDGSRRDSHEE